MKRYIVLAAILAAAFLGGMASADRLQKAAAARDSFQSYRVGNVGYGDLTARIIARDGDTIVLQIESVAIAELVAHGLEEIPNER